MPFEVEYTDEFGDWWDTLSEHEQDDVAATVKLSQIEALRCLIHTVLGLRVPNTATYGSCEYSMPENLIECCMHLIRAELRFCLSEEIKPEMTVGTKSLCPLLMLCMIGMSKS